MRTLIFIAALFGAGACSKDEPADKKAAVDKSDDDKSDDDDKSEDEQEAGATA